VSGGKGGFLNCKLSLKERGRTVILRKTCTVINKFKNVYQAITNMVKDEKGDLLAESHTILNQ
jgi:hypothetical protein